MSLFTPIINHVREADTLHDKTQCLTYLGRALSTAKKKITPDIRAELSAFAFAEAETVPVRLDAATCYREKDEILGYLNSLMNLVMFCYPSRDAVPADKLELIRRLAERMERERFLENAIDEAFRNRPDAADMERILCLAAPLKDEFQKGQLWQGLLHYKGQVLSLSDEAKAVLARYAVSELRRYAEERADGSITKDGYGNLEFLCDATRYLMTKDPLDTELAELIAALFEVEDPTIHFYALSTLLAVGYKVSDAVIAALAGNIEYADKTYHVLEQYRMTERFPVQYRDPVYLATSDLVQWLAYPTELGKQPDAIEYLGETKKKGEVFRVFRYRSDSDNLGDDLEGVWLIGWSGSDGGTFSNFDRYADYEQKTPEKTVKYIRHKLL